MEQPRIQYAQTTDGVSIAYWTLGEGMPLVHMPFSLISHLQLDWEYGEYRRWYERLAERRMLVRYDSRGTGLSDRDLTSYPSEAALWDLEAVIDRLSLQDFALMGLYHSGLQAIRYATLHPERVSQLVLWCSYARQSDYLRTSPELQALRATADKDWHTYTELSAQLALGWSDSEQARRWAAYMRECFTPEILKGFEPVIIEANVTNLLPEVKAPTLVLHRRQVAFPTVEIAKALATRIPNAQLTLLEGTSQLPFLGDTESVLQAIDGFLGEGEKATAAPELPEGMAVILFADIVESTALTEEMGDAAFRAKAHELDTSLRATIRECAGTPVEGKVLGDGVLAVFTSARQAIECALRCNAAGDSVGLQLHLGIHAGDVIREGNNVYGGAVNIAARIAGASAPGEVLVSDTVRGLARTSASVSFDDRGEHTLKGVADPQRLFAVQEGGAS